MAVQLFQSRPVVSMYQMQSNPVFDEAVLRGRLRFGKGKLFSRCDGARAVMRAVREGHGFFNLPDMDFGAKDAAFVPFFGVPAATLLAPSRMARGARHGGAAGGGRDVARAARAIACAFSSRWTDFPSDDALADTARMNHWIEHEVRRMPGAVPVGAQAFQDAAAGRAAVY